MLFLLFAHFFSWSFFFFLITSLTHGLRSFLLTTTHFFCTYIFIDILKLIYKGIVGTRVLLDQYNIYNQGNHSIHYYLNLFIYRLLIYHRRFSSKSFTCLVHIIAIMDSKVAKLYIIMAWVSLESHKKIIDSYISAEHDDDLCLRR